MEFTLLFAALAGVAPMWLAANRLQRTPGHPGDLADRALGATISGLFTGRLVAMVGVGVNPLTAPGDVLIIRGGVSTLGASLGALAFLAWSGRRETIRVAAGLAPAALVGLAGWHAGCVFRDACLASAGAGRQPVELYAAALLATGAGIQWLLRHRLPPLSLAGLALAWAAGVRLLTEPLRPSLTGGPRGAYAAGLLLGLAAATWGWLHARSRPVPEG